MCKFSRESSSSMPQTVEILKTKTQMWWSRVVSVAGTQRSTQASDRPRHSAYSINQIWFFRQISTNTTELVSWYFEPSQPQRITSGLKQTSICLLFTLHTSHQTINSPKTTKSVLTQIFIHNKTYTHIKHKLSEELVPSVLPLLKKHIRLGHAGIMDHSVDLSIPDFKKSIKKGMDRSNKKNIYYINA